MLAHPFFGRKLNKLFAHFIKYEFFALALFGSKSIVAKDYFGHVFNFAPKIKSLKCILHLKQYKLVVVWCYVTLNGVEGFGQRCFDSAQHDTLI